MYSDSKSIWESLETYNFVESSIVAAVVYDYLLTFSKEVEYVWLRPWTSVSTVFVFVRYMGLSLAIICGLVASSFVPGVQRFKYSCTTIFLVMIWEYELFLIAADWIMILRVYSMWHRSKTIIYILLFVYVPQIIISIVFLGIYYNPNTYVSVTVIQSIGRSLCRYSHPNIPSVFNLCVRLPRFILSAELLALAVIQTVKESVGMYKATGHWSLNQYLRLFVREGILYFLLSVLYNVINFVSFCPPESNRTGILCSWSYAAMCIMMSRFIISVRELYLKRGCQGIDAELNMLSQLTAGQHDGLHVSVSETVGFNQGRTVEAEVEDSRLEERRGNVGQV